MNPQSKQDRIWKRCLKIVRQLEQTKNRIRIVILTQRLVTVTAKMTLGTWQEVQM